MAADSQPARARDAGQGAPTEPVSDVPPRPGAGPGPEAPAQWRARAYCGPAHGYSWSISGTATPPILWEDPPVEVSVRYRLVHHPLTHLPARDQRGNLIYMPVRYGFES